MLIRIVSPWFVVGVECFDDGRKRAAPIVKYMSGWTVNRILRYSNKRGWKAGIVRGQEDG